MALVCICRLAAVHLVDAHLCTDPAKYISALLLSLSTMLHLELPHINLLSKIDLIEQYGKLRFNLDFYTEVGTVAVTMQMYRRVAVLITGDQCKMCICSVGPGFVILGEVNG